MVVRPHEKLMYVALDALTNRFAEVTLEISVLTARQENALFRANPSFFAASSIDEHDTY